MALISTKEPTAESLKKCQEQLKRCSEDAANLRQKIEKFQREIEQQKEKPKETLAVRPR